VDSPMKDVEDEIKKRAEDPVSDAFLNLQNIKPSYLENQQEGTEGTEQPEQTQDKEEGDFDREDEYDEENINDDEGDKGEPFQEGNDKTVKLKVNINVTNYKESKMNSERKTKTE